MSSNNEYNQMCGFKAAVPGADWGQCKQDSVLFLRSCMVASWRGAWRQLPFSCKVQIDLYFGYHFSK